MSKRFAFRSLALLLAAASILLSSCSSINSVIQPPTAIPFTPIMTVTPTPITRQTVKVERGDVVNTVTYSAKLISATEVQPEFQISGRLEKLPVNLGDTVTKGQLLAQLQNTVSDNDLKRAQINLDKAKLIYQQTDLNTPKWQRDYDLIMSLRKADVDLAQLGLDDLNTRIGASKLVSPMDGLITSLSIAEGSPIDPFKSIMVISDPNHFEVSATVLSPNFEKLTDNMPVIITLTSNPTISYQGTIRQRIPANTGLGSSSTSDPSVRISINDYSPSPDLTLGAKVKVQIDIDKRIGVLWLPPKALIKTDTGHYVNVLQNGVLVRVDVVVGLTTTLRVEILQGLTEGLSVVLP